MAVLTPEVVAWFTPGLAGTIAAVDPSGQPQVARLWGARVVGADELELCVQRGAAGALLDALVSGGRAAANLIEVRTYRSRLLKGWCSAPSPDVNLSFLEQHFVAVGAAFAAVGLPPNSVERLLGHAAEPRQMAVLRLVVESVFDQSPKPGAGAPL
jgi:hypothetical protein